MGEHSARDRSRDSPGLAGPALHSSGGIEDRPSGLPVDLGAGVAVYRIALARDGRPGNLSGHHPGGTGRDAGHLLRGDGSWRDLGGLCGTSGTPPGSGSAIDGRGAGVGPPAGPGGGSPGGQSHPVGGRRVVSGHGPGTDGHHSQLLRRRACPGVSPRPLTRPGLHASSRGLRLVGGDRISRWCLLEIDGDGHDASKDEFRKRALGLEEVRLKGEWIRSSQRPGRLEQKLKVGDATGDRLPAKKAGPPSGRTPDSASTPGPGGCPRPAG